MKKISKLTIMFLITLTTVFAIKNIETKAEETYGDWKYEVLSDGTVEIVSYTGKENNINIPKKIEGKTVTSIGAHAFQNRIYDGFMATATIPATVNNIESSAFSYGNIEKIVVSDSNKNYCAKNGVLYTKDMKTLMYYPNKYGKFNIPNGVNKIDSGAFNDAVSLTEIYFPKSVKNIDIFVFVNLYGLKNIEVSEKNKVYSSVDGVLFNKDVTSLVFYPTRKQMTYDTYYVPETVKKIEQWAFHGCNSLKNICLPEALETIAYEAFVSCQNLEYIYIPKSTKSIGELDLGDGWVPVFNSFEGCNKLTICGDKSSYAKEYAEKYGISWEEASLLKDSNIKLEKTSYVYDGKMKLPNISVKYKNKELKKYQDYVVIYQDNTNIGKATVVIQGQGKYVGNIQKTFTIKPKKVSGLKQVSAKKKAQIKMTWVKQSDVTGYEVYSSIKKNGTYKKVKEVKSNSCINKKLKSNKKYYYKVRAYKEINGKKIYGSFSKIIVMKTK